MSDVDTLLSEFIRTRAAGGGSDPRPFLNQVDGAERRELMALIDAHLQSSVTPRRRWDPNAFAGSRAEAIAADLTERHLAPTESSISLRALRAKADLKRAELVDRLSEALGLRQGRERVNYHYHRMETGLTPADSVPQRVLGALAKLLDSTPEKLRAALRAGELPDASAATKVVMTRMASAIPEDVDTDEADDDGAPSPAEPDPVEAEVDAVFLGGDE